MNFIIATAIVTPINVFIAIAIIAKIIIIIIITIIIISIFVAIVIVVISQQVTKLCQFSFVTLLIDFGKESVRLKIDMNDGDTIIKERHHKIRLVILTINIICINLPVSVYLR